MPAGSLYLSCPQFHEEDGSLNPRTPVWLWHTHNTEWHHHGRPFRTDAGLRADHWYGTSSPWWRLYPPPLIKLFVIVFLGVGDLTKINVPAGDAGGELDPHGADGNGKGASFLLTASMCVCARG